MDCGREHDPAGYQQANGADYRGACCAQRRAIYSGGTRIALTPLLTPSLHAPPHAPRPPPQHQAFLCAWTAT